MADDYDYDPRAMLKTMREAHRARIKAEAHRLAGDYIAAWLARDESALDEARRALWGQLMYMGCVEDEDRAFAHDGRAYSARLADGTVRRIKLLT